METKAEPVPRGDRLCTLKPSLVEWKHAYKIKEAINKAP